MMIDTRQIITVTEASLFLVRSYEPGEFVRQIPEQNRRKKA